MKEVLVSNGKIALVDDEDFELINKHKWFHNNGYAATCVRIDGKRKMVYMHRIVMNVPKWLNIDHINHNKYDNRRSNLRLCTFRQNAINRTKRSETSSVYKNVSKYGKKWAVNFSIHGEIIRVAPISSEREAAMLYNILATALYGKYASINNIPKEEIENYLNLLTI